MKPTTVEGKDWREEFDSMFNWADQIKEKELIQTLIERVEGEVKEIQKRHEVGFNVGADAMTIGYNNALHDAKNILRTLKEELKDNK